jgi:hypothetical protein
MVKFIDFNLVSSIVAGDYFVGHNASSNGELRATAQNIASDFATMIRPTWAQSLTDFRGIDLDVTNTASGAGSLLMRLAVGGVDKFTVDLDGNLSTSGDFSIGSPLVLDGNTSLTNDGSTIELGDNALTETHLFGNVGIGTTSPASLLDLKGNFRQLTLGDTGQSGAIAFRRATDGAVTSYVGYSGATENAVFEIRPGGGSAELRLGGSTVSSFTTLYGGAAEAIRIDSSGYVGIGTTSPEFALDVSGDIQIADSEPRLFFKETDQADDVWWFQMLGGDLFIEPEDTDALLRIRNVANQTVFAVDTSSGNVGIGTASPAAALDVSGDIALDGEILNSYGSLEVESNSTDITISGTDTAFGANAAQLLVFDTNGPSNGTTPDHTQDHITIDEAGTYLISFSVSFSGGSADTISAAFFINNKTTQLGSRMTRKLGTGGSVGSASHLAIATLAATDTVEVWFQNESATANITVEDACLSVAKLG